MIAALRAAEPKRNARAGKKEGGWGGKEFLPALAFVASFFASAIFRANEIGAPPEFVFILSKYTKFFNIKRLYNINGGAKLKSSGKISHETEFYNSG